ncbi:MAG: hypothetical protein K6L76_09825 [Agarilytica sp.]
MKKLFSNLFLAGALLFTCSAYGGVLYDVKILDLEVRNASGGYVIARLDQSFSTCAEGNHVKLNMDNSALSNASYTALLSAKMSSAKVDLLSSSSCEHFNVLERVKIK